MGRNVLIILTLLLPVACASTPPPPWEFIQPERELGRRLLAERRWDEAAELYGGQYCDGDWYPHIEVHLWDEIQAVWDSHDERFRDQLLHFHFRHAHFHRFLEWEEDPFSILEDLAGRGTEGLDFSHIDLFAEIYERKGDLTATDRDRVQEALRMSPESIPLILASLLLVDRADDLQIPDGGRGLFPSDTGLLALARLVATTWIADDYPVKAILRDAMEIAPTRQEKAAFHHASVRYDPRDYEPAAMLEVFEAHPDTSSGAEAVAGYIRHMEEERGPWFALDEIRRLQEKGFRGARGLEMGLVDIANTLNHRSEGDEAETILLEIARDYPEPSGPYASQAMMMLSWIAEEREDRKAQVDYFERAFRHEVRDYESALHLSAAYEAEGRWEDSRDVWTRFVPYAWGGCGNAYVGLLHERVAHISRCTAAAGDPETAVRWLVQYLTDPETPDINGAPTEPAVVLFEIYRSAEQVDDFREIYRAVEDRLRQMERRMYGFSNPQDLLEIHDLGERKALAELMEISWWKGGGSDIEDVVFRNELIQALVSSMDGEVETVFDELRTTVKGGLLLIDALALHPTGESLDALKRIAALDPLSDRRADRLGEAFARRGNVGKVILRRYASDPDHRLHETAVKWLRMIEEGYRSQPLGLPIPPGSLPGASEIVSDI